MNNCFLSCWIFSADNCQGGHLSFLLQVVKTPFLISVKLLSLITDLPFSLGSLSLLNDLLFKLISMSYQTTF